MGSQSQTEYRWVRGQSDPALEFLYYNTWSCAFIHHRVPSFYAGRVGESFPDDVQRFPEWVKTGDERRAYVLALVRME